jgi:hypothetical protein
MEALVTLSANLRGERTVISPHVVDPGEPPALGPLAAAGPRAAQAPGEYSLVVEAVREGYLLHYAEPRILAGHDANLALLAGDYLYALGLERLARLGDTDAVAELSDLISLLAACHAEEAETLSAPLWLAAAIAIGCGPADGHQEAKSAARRMGSDAAEMLTAAARRGARSAGLGGHLDGTGEAIDFRIPTR